VILQENCGRRDKRGRRVHQRQAAGGASNPVRATSNNLEAVLNALRRPGVEIEDDGLRPLKRSGR
jgi:hypothetical protein